MTKRTSPRFSRTKPGEELEVLSLYERIGAETVERLMAAFYARVDNDPVTARGTARRSPARSVALPTS
jgi:hypothetical protein